MTKNYWTTLDEYKLKAVITSLDILTNVLIQKQHTAISFVDLMGMYLNAKKAMHEKQVAKLCNPVNLSEYITTPKSFRENLMKTYNEPKTDKDQP